MYKFTHDPVKQNEKYNRAATTTTEKMITF